MIIIVDHKEQKYRVDLSDPLDLSLPIDAGQPGPNAFYADRPVFSPYQSGNFVASVKKGAAINSYDVTFNPHGNGTHTECQGHITKRWEKITDLKGDTHMMAKVVSIKPEQIGEDHIITATALKESLKKGADAKALVIRTLPNETEKKCKTYSGQNPPYIAPEGMREIVQRGVEHLLIDLPSVDREEDGGKVAAHHIFWDLNGQGKREHCTITEMIYVNNNIEDGLYFLDLQRASFALDCAPSRPILYRTTQIDDQQTSS